MQFSAAKPDSAGGDGGPLEDLVRQIGLLLRHPSYRRNAVVSALVVRHLPFDSGYRWRGEIALRDHLLKAQIDAKMLNHLLVGTRVELARLRGPANR